MTFFLSVVRKDIFLFRSRSRGREIVENGKKTRKQAICGILKGGGKERGFSTENNGEKDNHRVSRETIVNCVENVIRRGEWKNENFISYS